MAETHGASSRDLLAGFWRFCREDRGRYFASFVLMALTLVFDLARPFILKDALDQISYGALDQLKSYALLFLSFVAFEYVTRSGFNYLLSIAFLNTISRIRETVFRHVIRLKMGFFDREPIGRLMTRTINDAESLGESLRAGIATVFVDVLTVIGVLFVMLRLELRLAPVMLVTVPVVVLTVRWCGKKLREKYLAVRVELARSNGYMAEGINGLEVLQVFQKQRQSAERYGEINRDYRQATIWSNVYDASLYAVIDAISAYTVALVLMWSYGEMMGPIELSVMIVYINLVDRIYVPIRDLSSKFTVLQQALAALQRIFELLKHDARIVEGATDLAEGGGAIAFRGVSFRYGQGNPLVLKDISLDVRPGQVLALVGQTGSGKSTIGKLLTRSYDGYSGEILLDGVELRQLRLHDVRSKISVVHQDFEIFPGTIRENIRMFNPAIDDDAILRAIRMVKAEHMLGELPDGLDHRLREDGGNLSIGQLQLIIFARALAHDAPIIIMDEATASVDTLTESWIQDAVTEIFKRKTVIVVAHRLSTIASADEILVLKEGRVLQRGTHEELVTQTSGAYAELLSASKLAHGTRMQRQVL